ncbi:hypothetical protein ACWDAZ_40780, partial [Streptomyces sp. NPDC001215]
MLPPRVCGGERLQLRDEGPAASEVEHRSGASTDVPPGAVSLARPMEMGSIGPELDWNAEAWR